MGLTINQPHRKSFFFFSFSLDVVCYLHTPTYKAKMLKKEEKTKEKKKETPRCG
jgi:hypothetical protein